MRLAIEAKATAKATSKHLKGLRTLAEEHPGTRKTVIPPHRRRHRHPAGHRIRPPTLARGSRLRAERTGAVDGRRHSATVFSDRRCTNLRCDSRSHSSGSDTGQQRFWQRQTAFRVRTSKHAARRSRYGYGLLIVRRGILKLMPVEPNPPVPADKNSASIPMGSTVGCQTEPVTFTRGQTYFDRPKQASGTRRGLAAS